LTSVSLDHRPTPQAYAAWREHHSRVTIGRHITYRMLKTTQAAAFDAWRAAIARRAQLRAAAADVLMGGRLRRLRACLQQWREWNEEEREKRAASAK
jgi:hypothetical protein